MNKLILLAALAALPVFAQLAQPVSYVTSDPSGACGAGASMRYNRSNGKLWGCQAGTWTAISGTTSTSLAYYGNFSGLTPASSVTNGLAIVTDCATPACSAGSGSLKVLLRDIGSSWEAAVNFSEITASANVQSLLAAADYSAMRTLLGLVIGTNVQAYDADLTTYAGITPSANVQSLLGAADYAAARSLLGLVIGTNVQAYDADLTTYAGITPSANVQSLLGAADYAAIRSLLTLVIGTNVQAYDADLAAFAGLSCSDGEIPKKASGVWSCAADGGGGGGGSGTVSSGLAGCVPFYPANGTTIDDDACPIRWNDVDGQLEVDGKIATLGTPGPDEVTEIAAPGAHADAGKANRYIDSTTHLQCTHSNGQSAKCAALGDSSGKALEGDSASSFFSTGTLEDARLPSSMANKTITGTLTSSEATVVSGVVSASITANQNDYSPTGLSAASTLRLSTDASRNLTGLAGGAAGRILIIHNVGSNDLVLKDADTNSTAANRLELDADCTLQANQSFVLQYDGTSSRWRGISKCSSSSASVAYGSILIGCGGQAAGGYYGAPWDLGGGSCTNVSGLGGYAQLASAGSPSVTAYLVMPYDVAAASGWSVQLAALEGGGSTGNVKYSVAVGCVEPGNGTVTFSSGLDTGSLATTANTTVQSSLVTGGSWPAPCTGGRGLHVRVTRDSTVSGNSAGPWGPHTVLIRYTRN